MEFEIIKTTLSPRQGFFHFNGENFLHKTISVSSSPIALAILGLDSVKITFFSGN